MKKISSLSPDSRLDCAYASKRLLEETDGIIIPPADCPEIIRALDEKIIEIESYRTSEHEFMIEHLKTARASVQQQLDEEQAKIAA